MTAKDVRRAAQETKARLLYIVPTFNNPTGLALPEDARAPLLAECRRHGLTVLEDDPCPELGFARRYRPLMALSGRDDQVFYVRGFGKSFVPGMRLGIVVGPPGSGDALGEAKRLLDLHTSGILMAAFLDYLNGPGPDLNLAQIREVYGRRMAALLEALERHLQGVARWTVPDGGFNIWLRIPEPLDDSVLSALALARGLSLVPGSAFFPAGRPYGALRLSTGACDPGSIETGIRRLASLLTDQGSDSRPPVRIVV